MRNPHTTSGARRASFLVSTAMLALATGCSSAGGDDGESVEDFYSGREIRLIVTQPPGGGFDTYARLYAECMPQHIPGEPTVVVENMPGAGNVVGMNYLYTAAERDGSVFGTGEGGVALQQLFEAEGVLFDMGEMQYLGMPDAPVNMVLTVRADSGVDSVEQLLSGDESIKVGIPAPGSLLADPAILLQQSLGASIDLVSGYEGTDTLALAVEQGEVQGFLASYSTLESEHADKLSSGEWVTLVQSAEEGGNDYVEGVPSFTSLAADDEQRRLLEVGITDRAYIRPFFTPPGVPADRVSALRDAWQQCSDDDAFRQQAEEAGRPIDPVDGETLQEIYGGYINDTPPAVVEELKSLLNVDA